MRHGRKRYIFKDFHIDGNEIFNMSQLYKHIHVFHFSNCKSPELLYLVIYDKIDSANLWFLLFFFLSVLLHVVVVQ